jgi:hypothetical protein
MEDSKLLAEFMGKEWHNSFFAGVSIISPSNITYKFDTDWNWLMQVVEKIEGLGYRVEIVNSTSKIEPIITHSEYITKIEAVYNACVEFVKWYNDENNR